MAFGRSASRRSPSYSYSRYQEPISLAIRVGAILALLGVVIFFAAPLGYRLGVLSLAFASDRLFVWGANLAGVAAVLATLGLLATLTRRREARRGIGRALLAMAAGAVAFRAGGRLPLTHATPPLHDITTDTQHPPEYVTVAQLRGGSAVTTLAYPGEAVASQQQRAYPDIRPVMLAVNRDEAFARALNAVRNLGWTLVSADAESGRIEASAATRLFGTVDDVVVRVTNADGGSRVDVRSTSREAAGQASNASRVRAVLDALAAS